MAGIYYLCCLSLSNELDRKNVSSAVFVVHTSGDVAATLKNALDCKVFLF
jgi:hypothetical protein